MPAPAGHTRGLCAHTFHGNGCLEKNQEEQLTRICLPQSGGGAA